MVTWHCSLYAPPFIMVLRHREALNVADKRLVFIYFVLFFLKELLEVVE